MTAPTPEQRAAWRELYSDKDYVAEQVDADRILALLDALDAAERERAKWENVAEGCIRGAGAAAFRAQRAEAALARETARAADRCPRPVAGRRGMTASTEAVAQAMARSTAPTLDDGDGWETTAAVLAFEVGRLRDALDAAERRADRHGPCICGREEPDEYCPQHGRTYDDALDVAHRIIDGERACTERAEAALARVEALADATAEASWWGTVLRRALAGSNPDV